MRPLIRSLCLLLLLHVHAAAARPLSAADWWESIDLGGDGVSFSGSILIGATFPLTGDYEFYGQSAFYGAAARVRLINDAGGINGKRLLVVWRDNRSDAALAARQAGDLAQNLGVPAVIGPLLSDAAAAVRDLAEKHRFVAVTPMATTNSVVREGGWMFRTSFNNTAQANAVTLYLTRERGASSAAVLFDPRHAFSPELAALFAERFTDAGGRVTSSLPVAGEDGKKDFAAPLRRIAEEHPDVIFAPLYALEAIELMHALKEAGVAIPVCGSDTWDNELILAASGRRLAGTAFASPLPATALHASPASKIFFEAAERAGMENPDAQAAYAWDAVGMLEEAFKTGESGEELREGLSKITNLPLATGRLDILPDHDSRKTVVILRIEEKDNKLAPVFANRFDPFTQPLR